MDPLSQRSEQELRSFFRRKRTELSCLREPERLLNQLRDLDVIAEDQPEKVIKAKNKERALYQLLKQLEEKTPHKIRDFWECAFKEHILELYPEVKSLKEELFASTAPAPRKLPKTEEKVEEFKSKEQPGPSIKMKAPQKEKKKPRKQAGGSVPKKRRRMEPFEDNSLIKTRLHVTCGDKRGVLYCKKLAKSSGEKCVRSENTWFTPNEFQKFGGKDGYKNWKGSIQYKGKSLGVLIKKGILKVPARRQRVMKGKKKQAQPPPAKKRKLTQHNEQVHTGRDEPVPSGST